MHLYLSTQLCSALRVIVFPATADEYPAYRDLAHLTSPVPLWVLVFSPRTSYVESTHLFSNLCFVPVFHVCVILHAKPSEVTLLRCLVQELEHHRSRHAWIEVVGGKALVSRLVGFLPRSRVVTTAAPVSIKTMAAASNVHGGRRPYPILCLTGSPLNLWFGEVAKAPDSEYCEEQRSFFTNGYHDKRSGRRMSGSKV
jgi:hypothetical protein